MKLSVLTLFPDLVRQFLDCSIVGRAVDKGLLAATVVNIRDFAHDAHRTCDDAPYGGGAGMVLMPGPLHEALCAVAARGQRVIYPSPGGRQFSW
jgi:tRNA (guanine37-N1)-methyltransferase